MFCSALGTGGGYQALSIVVEKYDITADNGLLESPSTADFITLHVRVLRNTQEEVDVTTRLILRCQSAMSQQATAGWKARQ